MQEADNNQASPIPGTSKPDRPADLPTKKPKQKQLGKTKNDLKIRARKIAQALIAGKTETEAVKSAGYSAAYANSQKNEILKNPVIQKTFNQILDAAGLTDEKIANRIKELSEAREVKHFPYQVTEGKVKRQIIDEREVDALGIQANMIQFAAKLKGHLVEKTQETGELTIKVVKYGE